jgi:ribosomal-protein-alanine N-acetyltransferase
MGIKKAYLEVRRSNTAALALYTGFGFVQTGIRKGYYPDNKEDALLFSLNLITRRKD